MTRPPPAPFAADTPEDVEAAFYDALARADANALMALWADDDEIVCVHPGGPRVVGAAAIRASFEAIFAHDGIPVQPEQVHRLHRDDAALHHLVERIAVTTPAGEQVAWVLATNVYVRTPAGWRMAAHHASPGAPPEKDSTTAPDSPAVLH
jgi:uncharacterized protein (TIGR02246 family)